MRPEDYPPQESFSPLGQRYHEAVTARGAGVSGSAFGFGDDPYQSLLVYPAERPSGDVLAFVHGGGWTNGYKDWMAFMAPGLTAKGVTFVSIGYRLAPQHLFPAGLEDVAAGLAWVHREIAGHGGDPGRLFVGGHSAGGHYTSLLALRDDWQAARGLPPALLRGCLPVSGVFDFGPESGMSMRPRFLGAEGNEGPASPIRHIGVAPPPFFIAYGEKDFPHLVVQAGVMAEALVAAGGEVETMMLPGCDHLEASYASGDPDGAWVTRAVAWMRAH